jgi:5-hydroxyisourate hydrolase-like protein (transthyretin family)
VVTNVAASEDGKLMRTTFVIERAFRGPRGQVVVTGPGAGNSCSYEFTVGERYLVYADRGADGTLSTAQCSGTTLLAHAQKDLDYAENLPLPGSGGRVFGHVTRAEPDLLDGRKPWNKNAVDVVVTLRDSNGGALELRTDAEGRFEAVGLKPDRYAVSLNAPPTARVYYDGETFTLRDRGCAPVSIRYRSNGRITGRIVDANGLPARDVRVSAFPSRFTTKADYPNLRMETTDTDKDGRYEIGPLPPGEYQLGVNVESPPRPELPYPTTYFPGVPTRAEAGTVVLHEGEIGRANFVLPPKLARVTISGSVVFEDGTPAPGIDVRLSTGEDQFVALARTDAAGSFTLTGLSGMTYSVRASFWRSRVNASAETTLSIGNEPVTGVALVLKMR